jgi:hypothetical protein
MMNWEGFGSGGQGLIESISQRLPEATKETYKLLIIANVPAKVRTEFLRNASIERYRCTNPPRNTLRVHRKSIYIYIMRVLGRSRHRCRIILQFFHKEEGIQYLVWIPLAKDMVQ